jgi:hypothetical protein
MPWVDSHERDGKKVEAHYRTPPWVNTFLFIVLVILIAHTWRGK